MSIVVVLARFALNADGLGLVCVELRDLLSWTTPFDGFAFCLARLILEGVAATTRITLAIIARVTGRTDDLIGARCNGVVTSITLLARSFVSLILVLVGVTARADAIAGGRTS